MHKAKMIPLAVAALAYGCSDAGLTAAGATSAKQAAEICTGYEGAPAAAQGKESILADYRAGRITFNECLQRMRG